MGDAAHIDPEFWDAARAAEKLHEWGVTIKPATLQSYRRQGLIGCVTIGKRHYYTPDILAAFLKANTAKPCPSSSRSVSVDSATSGFRSIHSAADQTILGAEPGTIPEADRRAVLALAQATFRGRSRS